MILKPFHEIVGTLTSVESSGECTILVFSVQREFEIPKDAISMEKFEEFIGLRVGIFNNNENYIIRKIKRNGGGKG